MADLPETLLIGLLILLLLASAFFSASETGMVALNRYRLRHLSRQGHRGARRVEALLARTDRLLGMILVGNNFVNNYAVTLAALLAFSWFGNTGAALAPLVFTLILLICSEVTPKTFAARRPDAIAYPASLLLKPLMVLLAPIVWAVSGISNGLLRLVGVRELHGRSDDLSPEELRTVVNEAGALIPPRHQKMLLNILDLEKVTVEDIMIPRSEIVGIDIDDDIGDILNLMRSSQHTRLPIYRSDPNNVIGILHLRKVSRLLMRPQVNKAELMQHSVEPYFVPEGTPLHKQLINFQNARRRLGVVVDEYGDVLGLITLEDILEEIVGEFTTDLAASHQGIVPQEDDSFVIDGTTHLREINRTLHWELPTDGPKTLNGLILEHLEHIPASSTSFRLGDYLIEVMQVKDNRVRTARVRQRQPAA